MKKYVMPLIAIVLIIASLVIPSETLTPTVSAGPGKRENEEVTSIKELGDVLTFISEIGYDEASENDGSGIELLSYGSDKSSKKKYKHSSVTVTEDTVLKQSSTHRTIGSYNGYEPQYKTVASSKTSLKRSMTMYITKDATYYVTRGNYSYDYDDKDYKDSEDNESKTVGLVFDMCIYVDEDIALVKFTQFSMNSTYKGETETMSIDKDYIDKWIMLPREGAGFALGLVDSTNRGILEEIGELISSEEDDIFKKKHDKYIYEDRILADEDEKEDMSVTVDFSVPECPNMNWFVDANDEYNDLYLIDNITFFNIDNTVIDINDDKDSIIEFDDMEEFEEECFGG